MVAESVRMSLESEVALLSRILKEYALGYRPCIWFQKCMSLTRKLKRVIALKRELQGAGSNRGVPRSLKLKAHCFSVMRLLLMEIRAGLHTHKLSLVLLASVAQIKTFL